MRGDWLPTSPGPAGTEPGTCRNASRVPRLAATEMAAADTIAVIAIARRRRARSRRPRCAALPIIAERSGSISRETLSNMPQLPGLCRGELEKLLFGIGGMISQRGSLAACLALDVTNTDAVIGALSIGAAAGISLSFQPSMHWSGEHRGSRSKSSSNVYTQCLLPVYAPVVTVPLTLLGLLEREPSHGYDLKRDYDTYFGRGKPLPFGQVYATLGRLARDGKVVVGDVGPG